MNVPKDHELRYCTGNNCGAKMFFRYTENGKRMPLDWEPTEEEGQGVYVLTEGEKCRRYSPLEDSGKYRYMTHYSTCVDRDRFRKGKR